MANRLYRSEYLQSFQSQLVFLEGRATIGAAGAVTGLQGTGISAITKLGAAGTYLIRLEDGYNRLLNFNAFFQAPVTGAAVGSTLLAANTTYRITAVGTTDFTAIGARANTVGVTFVATAAGTGTGTATAVGNTAIVAVEVADTSVDGPVTSALSTATGIIIQCKSASATVANPSDGSVILFSLLLRNSSSKGKGEA